jgi:hypothetical protein
MEVTPATVRLLQARLYWRDWTGVLTLALLDAERDSTLAWDISTYTGGPRRTLGIELRTDKIECEALADAGGQTAVKTLEHRRS